MANLETEDHLAFREDGVVLGDGEVVNHSWFWQCDGHSLAFLSIRRHSEVCHIRLLHHVVAQAEHLPCLGINFRMRSHGTL